MQKVRTRRKLERHQKTVHAEREKERDPEVEMMVRKWWTKRVNQIIMGYFYRSDPTTREYQKRMIAIWREIGIFEITEQRLVDQVRVIRTNE